MEKSLKDLYENDLNVRPAVIRSDPAQPAVRFDFGGMRVRYLTPEGVDQLIGRLIEVRDEAEQLAADYRAP